MADNKKYFWLKLKEDFFRQKEIKKLRKVAGGDTFTIIYLKFQLLSLKKDGKLFYEGIEEDFADEMALELDETTENVQMTIAYLMKHNLLELVNTDGYLLPKAVESMGKESDSAERVRKHREKKKLQCNDKKLQCNDKKLLSNGCNNSCNTEIEKEKEKEIYKTIVDYLNIKSGKQFKYSTTKTKDLINARINEGFTEEEFKRVIDTKVSEWADSDMNKFLRPETLFSNKFEGYLNQKKAKEIVKEAPKEKPIPRNGDDELWEKAFGIKTP